jgi:hypothetical protein
MLILKAKHKLYLIANFVAKFHMNWAGIESRFLLWEVSD